MRALVLVAMALPLIACSAVSAESGETVEARGTGPSRDFAVSGFSSVELRGSDDIEVRVGSGFSVRAQGPSAELDKLEILRDGDALVVRRKRSNSWGWSKSEGVKVFVTMPRIAGASVAGSGNMAVDRVEGDRFAGSIAGSGNLSVSAMRVDEADLSIAGSGDLVGAGSARRLEMSIAGSGDIDARQLTASEAEISIAGSGNARAVVNGPAKVSTVGSGDVELGGNPRCTTSVRGSGEVRCV
ncbi:MAG TPA: head GIN domain-containing protein [Sphingomonas sp.]|jgi:hypothetical protein